MTDLNTTRGTLGVGEGGDFRIHFERTLHHPPERVWQWITDGAKRERWLPGCEIDPRVGGTVRFDFGDEGAATGSVSEIREPGAGTDGTGVLVHSWAWEGVPDSVVRWVVEPALEGTRLTLDHGEVLPEPAVEFAVGWHLMLDALALDLDDRSAGQAWTRAENVAALYAGSAGSAGSD